jgi:sigma-B regulation protein RsbU (phosphoserine phosphatase)
MKVKYSGAGDLPMLLKKSSGEFKKIQSRGLLLGFADSGEYKDEEINLSSGDSLILMTDGIIESRNSEGIQFGTARLPEIILNTSSDNNFVEKIKEELEAYTSGKYEDDISLISIKVL